MRLKDKLGNRSNASAEIELRGAEARLVGEEGRGVQTIIEMVNHTRLDCVLGSTALQRRAVAEATHHAAHREAFGRRLAEQPLMQNVLADLCLESEAATLTALRVARAYDEGDHAFRRLATAVAKYWVCKVTPSVVGEALECLGGNGYVEESGLPRLYRESPLNSIWEGAGNVNCLDVLRALARSPESLDAYVAEVRLAEEPAIDRALDEVARELEHVDESRARYLVERLALALQASLLVRHGDPAVAEAFCATRLDGRGRPGVRHAAARARAGGDRRAAPAARSRGLRLCGDWSPRRTTSTGASTRGRSRRRTNGHAPRSRRGSSRRRRGDVGTRP